MPTLYIAEPGARIEKTYRRLEIRKADELLTAVPLVRIDHVVLVGPVGLTTPAMNTLLDAGVGVSLLNRWGKLRGRLAPATDKNLYLRRLQYRRAGEPDLYLAISGRIVQGKLRNARNLARRILRRNPHIDASPLQRIDQALRRANHATEIDELLGNEGLGTRSYFAIWRQALEPPWTFRRRSRRPPKDPVNAMLSLGYTLLADNLMTACEIVGLDPYEGFYHVETYGRPALALDLMEEFRHLIVDSVVMGLVNRNRIKLDDFQPGPKTGVYLKPDGMRTFFAAYAARIHTCVKHPLAARPLSYQKIFEVQARQLRKLLEGKIEVYKPFLTR
ncbi:MAG: CRISPR-associated endonuclease Cas1 [Chloroflexi bacterium]|nr:CRISPR-associated endonuclease Cas1 [Chloroflexota bacterium]